MATKFLAQDFFFGCYTFSKKGSWGLFLAHERQYRRMGLVYFVKSSQGFIHAQNKHKQREIAFFFYRTPDSCIVFGCNNKVTQKMAELCTEYPSLTIIAWSE